jgi:hypothetical protein
MSNLFPSSSPHPACSLVVLGLFLAATGPAQAQASFAPVSTYTAGTGSTPTSVAVADVNGDGQPDLITANFGTSTAGVLLGRVGGGFAPVITYPAGANGSPRGVAVADVNGDSRPDIVTANSDDTAGVLLGQAGGGFSAASPYSTGANSNPGNVAVGDVNGDGRPDLVTANYGTSTAGVLLGQAGGGFAPVSTYPASANSPLGVAVADVNSDGRLDIILANLTSSTVGVLLNTGTFAPLAAAATTTTADVTLFPNPARGGFAVQLPAAWGAAPVRAELLNALGQVVAARTALLTGRATLPFATAGLALGVYVLRVQASGHTLVKRVVLD